MTDRAGLVQELRHSFKDGATPSRLIRDVVKQLGDSPSYWDVEAILTEAFQLPVVRLNPSIVSGQKVCNNSIYNKALLAEIVQNRDRWDTFDLTSCREQSSWLQGLRLASPQDTKNKVEAAPYPGLSKASWAALHPDEREALFVQLASSMVLSDRVDLLSRLAERLQEKIDLLEDKLQSADLGRP
jgi:hypothetical protein